MLISQDLSIPSVKEEVMRISHENPFSNNTTNNTVWIILFVFAILLVTFGCIIFKKNRRNKNT